jgi:hypothetical protein
LEGDRGFYKVFEVKAEGVIEDSLVRAKRDFAEKELRSSNVQYEMIPASKYNDLAVLTTPSNVTIQNFIMMLWDFREETKLT